MAVISICAKKGGNGKTTTAINFAIGLSAIKKKVLLIDMDSQCNLSSGIGVYDPNLVSIYSVLMKQCNVEQAIQNKGKLDVIQSEVDLNDVEIEIGNKPNKLMRLKEAINKVKDKYDYVIIDTPPSIEFLTQSALIASDEVIIVSQADKFSLDGLYQLDREIQKLKNKYNPELKIDGILITRYVSRTSVKRMIKEEMAKVATRMNTKVYETNIRENVSISESQVLKMSVYKHNRRSNGSKDYYEFVKEYLKKKGEKVSDLLFLNSEI